MTFWDETDSDLGVEERSSGRRERPGGWLVIGIVLLLALVVGGAYAATAAINGDKVPLGTTVSGIDIGGLSRADARSELTTFFDRRSSAPLRVTVAGALGQGRSARTTLARIGFSIDYDTTLDDAGAVQAWTPARQWDYFTGGHDVDPVVRVDEQRLRARLAHLAQGLRTPARDGRVVITRHGVSSVDPEAGQEIDLGTAANALAAAFLSGDRSVELAVVPARPDIDAADVRHGLADFANPAMSGSVVLHLGRYTVRLRPQQFGAVLSMVPQDGALQPHVDTTELTMLVDTALSRVVPPSPKGAPGALPKYLPDDLRSAFLGLLTRPEGRREGDVPIDGYRTPNQHQQAHPSGP